MNEEKKREQIEAKSAVAVVMANGVSDAIKISNDDFAFRSNCAPCSARRPRLGIY